MLTLIRHGQAGSRLAYDDLSETGREQSRALGLWLRERKTHFDAVVVGGLNRQKITAQEILAAMAGGANGSCEPRFDQRWSEFDLDLVYAGIGPLLAREDERFRAEYEALQIEVADPASSVHRTWRSCDVAVVRAWIDGRFEWDGESFDAFRQRIHEALAALPAGSSVAVVTSATPIAICIGAALELSPRRLMQLAGATRNTSFSEIAMATDGLRLVSFNNVPHLADERLRTLR